MNIYRLGLEEEHEPVEGARPAPGLWVVGGRPF